MTKLLPGITQADRRITYCFQIRWSTTNCSLLTMSTQDLNYPINDIFGRRLSTEWISY